MNRKVIEPSEIIDKQDYESPKKKVNPWIRFLARSFDYSLFYLVLWMIKFFLGYERQTLGFLETIIPFEFFCWIPIETLFLIVWGKTPGKWLLNIELQFARKKKPTLMSAWHRSFSVWCRGIGLGIPVINVLCMLNAYHRFRITQTTSWDLENQIYISCHLAKSWRLITAIAVVAGGIFAYSFS